MNTGKDSGGSFNSLVGNIIAGIAVVTALIVTGSWIPTLGLLALPHIWTNRKIDWKKRREFIYGVILGIVIVSSFIITAILLV